MIDQRIIDQFNARAPFKLEEATILVGALIGSDSHNTKIPNIDPNGIDDTDYLFVVIPPISYSLGIKEWHNVSFQYEELDCVFYSFKKFVQLLIKSNPNVLGLPWLKLEHYIVQSKEWIMLLENRDIFSSLNAYPAFIGYAHGQMHKMQSLTPEILQSYEEACHKVESVGWKVQDILDKKSLPMPDYGFVYSTTTKDSIETDLHAAKTEILKYHAKYNMAYMGQKRKNLVKQHGYDAKNSAHLIRLMKTCNEFLASGQFNVFRTYDAEMLKDIKKGKWTLDEVKIEADRLFKEAEELKSKSILPKEPDLEAIDKLTQAVYLSAYELERKTSELDWDSIGHWE